MTSDTLMRASERAQLLMRDRVRFSPTALRAFSRATEMRARLGPVRDPNQVARQLDQLAKAARAGTGLRDLGHLEAQLRAGLARWSPQGFDWDAFFSDTQPAPVRKAIILKTPQSAEEKGVLFVAFENQWIRLLRHAQVAALARDYDLVLSPTWSPPQDLAFLLALKLWPNELYTILSHFDDIPAFRRLSDRVRPIPLLASSWVNPELVGAEREREQEFDIAMIANFAIYKRHFALFAALAKMDRTVRALLLGTSWEGRKRETLLHEADLFGVRDRIEIREGLPDAEMFRALRSARVCVLMSMNEGSCVAVVESLFADVPVGLLEGARVGSSAFLNAATGRLLRPRHLAADLAEFLAAADACRPRQWALAQGIDCWASSRVLNEALKQASEARGRRWTRDLAPFHWRPNAKFLRAEDSAAMDEAYARFPAQYGLTLDRPR